MEKGLLPPGTAGGRLQVKLHPKSPPKQSGSRLANSGALRDDPDRGALKGIAVQQYAVGLRLDAIFMSNSSRHSSPLVSPENDMAAPPLCSLCQWKIRMSPRS